MKINWKILLLILTGFSASCSSDTEEKEEVDNTPPQITISSPQDGSTFVTGESINITASASDNTDVRFLKLYINGQEVHYTEASTFQYTWETIETPLGQHTIKVEASDIANNPVNKSISITIGEPQFNVNINGVIKSKQTGEALSGISVSLAGETATTNQNGEYSFNKMLSKGHYSISTSPCENHIETTIGIDINNNYTSNNFNINLYPKPGNIKKQATGFIKGVSLFDAGPWMGMDLYPDAFAGTFTRLANNQCNTVTVFDPVFVVEVGDNSVKMATSANSEYQWDMLTATQYEGLSTDARSNNLNFMYWFGVWPHNEKQLSGKSFNATVFGGNKLSDVFWNSWFSEYTRILVDYAMVAETQNVAQISLGHGLNYATSPYLFSSVELYNNSWKGLIDAIRAVYSGEIIYFGANRSFTTASYEGNSEIEYYEDASYTNEFKGLFDAFGVILSSITPSPNPTIDEIKSSVKNILSRYETFGKPIILWVWAPSADGAANKYGHLEPVLDVSQAANNYEVDFYEQADIYEGIFEAINESTTAVKGIISHGYMYYDTFNKYEPRDMSTAFDKAASVRDKPAEGILKYWFENM